MSSFLLQFLEGKMRSYHRSNQHKHFNKSDIMNRCATILHDWKNIFMIQIIIRMASITQVLHLFSMKHIFRREFSFLIYTEKRKEEKTEFERSSWWHKIRLSLKRGFDGCGHGFGRCDGLDGLGRFNRLSGFGGFVGLGGFDGLDGFSGFSGFSWFDGFGGCDGFSGFGGFVF